MKDAELGQHNLNHLVVLWAILERGGVTQAAQALGRSQSAVSHVLAQLRQAFSDPLLVRVSGKWEPTPMARRLAAELGPALLHLHDAVRGVAFDPETSTRDITLFGSAHLTSTLLRGFLANLRAQAPRLELRVLAGTRGHIDRLMRGEIDLAVVVSAPQRAGIHTQALLVDTYTCLAPTSAIRADGALSLDSYCALPHLLITPTEASESFVEDALATLGRAREIALRLPLYSLAVELLELLPGHILTLPSLACPRDTPPGYVEVRAPLVLPAIPIGLAWHQRHHTDPGHTWVRETLMHSIPGAPR